MKPSEKVRKHYLKVSSVHTMVLGFEVMGGIILAAGIVMLVMMYGKVYTVNGSTVQKIPGWSIGLLVILFGAIFFAIGKFFFTAVYRALYKEETEYPVYKLNHISPEMLKREAQKINTFGSPWLVSVEGDWIDVTSRLYSRKLSGKQVIYKKMFRIRENGTYRELDLETREDIRVGYTHLTFSKKLSCGHLQHHMVPVTTDEGTISFSTLELANDMHRWFGEHGYTLMRD